MKSVFTSTYLFVVGLLMLHGVAGAQTADKKSLTLDGAARPATVELFVVCRTHFTLDHDPY